MLGKLDALRSSTGEHGSLSRIGNLDAFFALEAPELFACRQVFQMLNVGLSAFSQPRRCGCNICLACKMGLHAFSGLAPADRVVMADPLTFRNLVGPRVCDIRWGCMVFSGASKKHSGLACQPRSCSEPAYVSKLGWRTHGCMLEPAKSVRALRLLTTQPRSRTRVLAHVPERRLLRCAFWGY